MLYKLPKATSMPGTIHIPKILLHSLRRNLEDLSSTFLTGATQPTPAKGE